MRKKAPKNALGYPPTLSGSVQGSVGFKHLELGKLQFRVRAQMFYSLTPINFLVLNYNHL